MTGSAIRKQLHKQINTLPDDIVQQIADFALFIVAKQQASSAYADWNDKQWQQFVLEQFFAEEDEVEYTLKDAQEVYRS